MRRVALQRWLREARLPASVADWPDEARFAWLERAAIMEFDGGFGRGLTEREAERLLRADLERGRSQSG